MLLTETCGTSLTISLVASIIIIGVAIAPGFQQSVDFHYPSVLLAFPDSDNRTAFKSLNFTYPGALSAGKAPFDS
jgi:pantothenate kinase type III